MGVPAGNTSTTTTGTTLDVVTLAEAKAGLNIATSDTTSDVELAAYITAASRRLDDYIGPIVQRTVTEVHDGAGPIIVVRAAPIASVTSLTEYRSGVATVLTGATSPDLTTGDSYMVDTAAGIIRRYTGSGLLYRFWPGTQNVTVVFVAGRAVSTETADPLFKLAANLIIRKLWSGRGAGAGDMFSANDGAAAYSVPSFALPNAVVDLVGHLHVPAVA